MLFNYTCILCDIHQKMLGGCSLTVDFEQIGLVSPMVRIESTQPIELKIAFGDINEPQMFSILGKCTLKFM